MIVRSDCWNGQGGVGGHDWTNASVPRPTSSTLSNHRVQPRPNIPPGVNVILTVSMPRACLLWRGRGLQMFGSLGTYTAGTSYIQVGHAPVMSTERLSPDPTVIVILWICGPPAALPKKVVSHQHCPRRWCPTSIAREPKLSSTGLSSRRPKR